MGTAILFDAPYDPGVAIIMHLRSTLESHVLKGHRGMGGSTISTVDEAIEM
jgi:hypothetical protein